MGRPTLGSNTQATTAAGSTLTLNWAGSGIRSVTMAQREASILEATWATSSLPTTAARTFGTTFAKAPAVIAQEVT